MGSGNIQVPERQLQEQVKCWQAQTQALQQEGVHLKTEMAAAYLAVRKNIIWGAPVVPLAALLLLTAPYYTAYLPAVCMLDAVLTIVALTTLVMMILDVVYNRFWAGSKVKTADAGLGTNMAAGHLVCGTPVSDYLPLPWWTEQRNCTLRGRALIVSGGQLASDLLQVGTAYSSNKNPSQKLAVLERSVAKVQEQAKAWQIQQQALCEEEENARLKTDLARALEQCSGFANWRFTWFVASVFVFLVLQFIVLVPPVIWSISQPGFGFKVFGTFFCWIFLVIEITRIIFDHRTECRKLSEKSKKLLEELAKSAPQNVDCCGKAQIKVICLST